MYQKQNNGPIEHQQQHQKAQSLLETKLSRRDLLKVSLGGLIGTGLSSCIMFNHPLEGRFIYDVVNHFGVVLVKSDGRTLVEVFPFPGGMGAYLTSLGLSNREQAYRALRYYLDLYSAKTNSNIALFNMNDPKFNMYMYIAVYKINPNQEFKFRLIVDITGPKMVYYNENQVFLPRSNGVFEFAWNYNQTSIEQIRELQKQNPNQTLFIIDGKVLKATIDKYIEVFKAPTEGIVSRNYLIQKYPPMIQSLYSQESIKNHPSVYPENSVLIVRP